jgi:mono/diheme cytochrome c family protein/peroxiredoxin
VLAVAGLGVLVLGVSAGAAVLLRKGGQQPPTPAADLAGRGRLVYQVYCASCHGPEGHGDGSSAATLKPPSRDFAVRPWKFGTTPEAVRRVIADGIRGTAMPSAGQALSAADLDAVVAHVLTLAAVLDSRPQLPAKLRPLLQRAGFVPADQLHPAPALDLRDTTGKRVTLAALHGKLVLVDFWAMGCLPCQAKLPRLEQLADEFGSRGVIALAVCADESEAEAVRDVAAKRLHSLPAYLDPGGLARVHYDVQMYPTACLIDPAGRLLGSGPGPDDWLSTEARELLDACLATP